MKIKVAHEAPISILNEVRQLTDYDYCLVHLLDQQPEYKRFFYEACTDREILLDNSIFELGKAFDTKEYVRHILDLNPNFYIVPDVLEDTKQTIDNFLDFYGEYKNLPGLKIGAIQGTNYSDIKYCYQHMSEFADYIAISFDFKYYEVTGDGHNKLQKWCNGRQRLISSLISDGVWNWNKPHHLLGASLPQEMRYYVDKNIYNIRSVDTSNPVMAGIKGLIYNGDLGLQDKPVGKLCDSINYSINNHEWLAIKYNINSFKSILRQ